MRLTSITPSEMYKDVYCPPSEKHRNKLGHPGAEPSLNSDLMSLSPGPPALQGKDLWTGFAATLRHLLEPFAEWG